MNNYIKKLTRITISSIFRSKALTFGGSCSYYPSKVFLVNSVSYITALTPNYVVRTAGGILHRASKTHHILRVNVHSGLHVLVLRQSHTRTFCSAVVVYTVRCFMFTLAACESHDATLEVTKLCRNRNLMSASDLFNRKLRDVPLSRGRRRHWGTEERSPYKLIIRV